MKNFKQKVIFCSSSLSQKYRNVMKNTSHMKL